MKFDMGELSQDSHYFAEAQPGPPYVDPNEVVSPLDSDEGYPLGIPPSQELDSSKGYPTYKGSDVHYVTFELAQMIAAADMAARYTRPRMERSFVHYREDAVQEALLGFMKSYRDCPPDLTENTIYALFYGILGHKIADIYRRVKRRPEELTGDIPHTMEQSAEDRVLTGLDQTHAALMLHALSTHLPPVQRQLLAHYIAHPDLSGRENAELLGKTEGNERAAKHRLIASMRARYEQLKEAGIADNDIVTQLLLRMGRALKRQKTEQLPLSSIQHRLHEKIHEQRLNRQREVELVVPPYLGQWAVGATDLKAYLGLVQDSARAAIVYPHKDQLGEFEAYIRPQLEPHSKATTIFTPDTLRSAPLDRLSYVITPPDIEPALLLKLYRHANFVLHLVDHDTESRGIPRIDAPKYSSATHATEWSKTDSIRYIREAYFTLGRSPSENDLKALSQQDQGPSIYRSSKDFASLASLVLEALTPLRS